MESQGKPNPHVERFKNKLRADIENKKVWIKHCVKEIKDEMAEIETCKTHIRKKQEALKILERLQ